MKTDSTTIRKNAKGLAKTSLMECMGAVSAALAAMPDNVVRMPASSLEAFLLVDPALSMLNRQLLDARRNTAQLAALFGGADPMLDALNAQIAALEAAYAERLALLRKKREEGRAKKAATEQIYKTEGSKPLEVRQMEAKRRHNHDALWLWALFLMMTASKPAVKNYGPKLDAA